MGIQVYSLQQIKTNDGKCEHRPINITHGMPLNLIKWSKDFQRKKKAKKKNEDVQFLNECINWKTAWLWSNR